MIQAHPSACGGQALPGRDSRLQSRRTTGSALSAPQHQGLSLQSSNRSAAHGTLPPDGAPLASQPPPSWPWRSHRQGRSTRLVTQARSTSTIAPSAVATTSPAMTLVAPPSGSAGPSNRPSAGWPSASRAGRRGAGWPIPAYSPSGLRAEGSSGPTSPTMSYDSATSRAPPSGSPASQTSAAKAGPPLPALRPTSQLQAAAAAAAPAGPWLATRPAGGGGGRPLQMGEDSDIDIPEFMEPSTYDAAMNSRYWETRPVRVVSRLLRIGVEFGGWLAATRARNLRIKDPAAQEAAAAESLKDVLVRLGPAFVKIGQALSSRPDVLPPPYIAALEALQDRIPPFPDQAAMAVLQSELGVPPSAVFSRLSPSPVAAASLGQVYRGVLRPELGGAEVAVKVQRPRVAQMIAQDVYILRILAGWLRRARRFNTDLPALVDEWASSLFRELNYRTEADNARRFKELFSHLPQVYVPYIYDEYTTAKILTMEWIEGERLRTAGTSAAERSAAPSAPSAAPSARGSSVSSGGGGSSSGGGGGSGSGSALRDPRRLEDLALVEVGVRCSLEQMLEEGFYHADPHPGNLLRTPDGRLAYLDFGMMGQIDERTRNALMTATLHLVNREYGRLAEDFVTLGLLPPGTDRETVLPALTGVFSEALKGGVSNLSFGQLSGNLGVTMYKYSFRIPPYYTLLVRSLSVLEGIALAADPNYKVLGSAYPWIARRLLTDPSPDLRTALRRLLYTEEGQFRFDRLESLLRQAAKSANRLKRPQQQQQGAPPSALSSVDGATATSGGSGTSSTSGGGGGSGGGALLLLLSRDGEFVRGILLDEVAKGIDGAWRIAADATVSTVRQGVAGLPTPALPLLALLPGAPLLAMLAMRGGGDDSGGGSGGGGAMSVQQSLSAALSRLPALASADDRTQVAGLLQLGNALADVSGIKLPMQQQGSGDGDGGSAGPRPPASPAELYGAAAQASEALLWLAREAVELPDEARGELLLLPLQLGSRVASRVTARALRAVVLGGNSSGSGGGSSGLEEGRGSSTAAGSAELVPPAGP
ncbi:hypothetical protein PLESTB_000987700 [Pleodorina starrii]|uniref:ABC1 atypical kinase-like domain-containing protein n=1 Tax=Pleodorina starrii TaxID=330485 RepID=A0A9W6BNV0_9CHLO|nr:hypothetical protein PLESTM_000550300 [Pleodorina starrii]GLC55443.1 hypothetical protein PLESTB_000987700 [Pleodorina starrii]GLC73836.1 hypothetical protein PLESTF_001426100 [Pleodorina starrii]